MVSCFLNSVLAKKLISFFSSSETFVIAGRFSGGSPKSVLPHATFLIPASKNPGGCQIVARSAPFKTWFFRSKKFTDRFFIRASSFRSEEHTSELHSQF